MKKSNSVLFLIIFGVFWCSLVGTFDFFLFRGMYHQLRALGFASAPGVIVSSGYVGNDDDEKRLKVRYHYSVEGEQFEGDRVRYALMTENDGKRVRKLQRMYTVNSNCTVYYNPNNPSEAVLQPGLTGSELFMLMFLTPFNAIGLGFVLWPFASVFRRFSRKELPGFKIKRERMRTNVSLPTLSPLASAIATLVVGAFLMIFIVAFTGSGFDPSLEKVTVAWVVLFVAALGVYAWRWMRQRSGVDDLIIDVANGVVSLPLTHGRKQRVLVPHSDIRSAEIIEEEQKDSEGGSTTQYFSVLNYREGSGATTARLAQHMDRQSGDIFVAWLRRELRLTETAPAKP